MTPNAAMIQQTERWVAELTEAGWTKLAPTTWRAPSGALYLGPFGAWKAMKAGAK